MKGPLWRRSVPLRFCAGMILVALLLTSCWDLREIDHRSIAAGLGIDRTEEGAFVVTAEFPVPAAFEVGGTPPDTTHYARSDAGATFTLAMHNVNLILSRDLFLGHMEVVLLGADAARESFAPVIAALARRRDVQRPTLVAVTEGRAADVFGMQLPQEMMVGTYLVTLFERGNRARRIPYTPLWRVESALARPWQSVVVPLLKPEQDRVRMTGLAVIRDGHMVGHLDPDQMQGYLWVLGDVVEEVIVLRDSEESLSVTTLRSSSRIEPILVRGKPVIRLEISAEAKVAEEELERTLTSERLLELERRTEQQIKQLVEETIAQAQALHADIFGFGHLVRAKMPHAWKRLDWAQVYPTLRVDINVRTHLRRTGAAM